ncbi:MAG: hypothetical protein H6738_09545 [Alphaproteobacteria bacterium]|nr:hypothetical protein [Alphaproteobacteria bacterium]
MSPDPRHRAVASLLAQGRPLHHAALALALGSWVLSDGSAVPSVTALGLLGIETWLAVRVGLDADLFDALARGMTPEDLDDALVGAGLLTEERPARTVASRIGGALRLWRLQLASVTLLGTLAALCAFVWGWA